MQKFYQLFNILDKWKGGYLLAGVLLAFSSFVRMLEPKIIQMGVDEVAMYLQPDIHQHTPDVVVRFFYALLPNMDPQHITWGLFCIGTLLMLVVILKALTWFGANVMVANYTEQGIKQFRDRLFNHIQRLSLTQMSKIPKGEMIQRCTGDIGTIQKFIGTQISELIRLGAIGIGAFWMMCLVHVGYAFISIALFVPIITTSYIFFKREQNVWEEHEEEQDKLTAIIQENLSGIRVVQAFSNAAYETKRFAAQNKAKRTIGVRHIDLHMVFWPLSDLLINIQIALSLLAGAYYTVYGVISIGEYASFFSYSIMVTFLMRNLGRVVSQLGMAGVAMERITQILNGTTEDYSGEAIAAKEQPMQTIEFKNVWFAYPTAVPTKANKNTATSKTPKWALKDVSFKVEAGEQLAIMGPTGAGKSTIIALLLRFYEPDRGEILINNHPLSDYAKPYLRKQIGVVLQKPFLFSTSIRENIAYAQIDRTGDLQLSRQQQHQQTDFEAAAKDACVADFIDKMAEGYETLVGEKGVTLSGGQKQRVALARTLLSDPQILVLDDATSAVDTETEYRIQQALQKRMKDKTTLIIAHRLTAVQQAQHILVLQDGMVLEYGTHEALLQQNKFYKQVYDIQVQVERLA